MRCPKCGAGSGNDWRQCLGVCPIKGSPHYSPLCESLTARGASDTMSCHGCVRGDGTSIIEELEAEVAALKLRLSRFEASE